MTANMPFHSAVLPTCRRFLHTAYFTSVTIGVQGYTFLELRQPRPMSSEIRDLNNEDGLVMIRDRSTIKRD